MDASPADGHAMYYTLALMKHTQTQAYSNAPDGSRAAWGENRHTPVHLLGHRDPESDGQKLTIADGTHSATVSEGYDGDDELPHFRTGAVERD